ncbi:putative disease resistance protein RGA3 isoform X2 [Macadamia integrifolia]|uniref:putative disease resistance protein RGA3 isoform X2 n=1 Tax=Macadamia integrifolia TaxID=60698 RepID=UPI001C4EE299|nr:putative disease resistance protein RGA3 isoform X2 [Macadamia integrifolia]
MYKEITMSMRDYAAGKMGMRDFAAAGKELMISSTTLGRRRGRGVQEEYEKLQGIVRETKVILMDLEWRNLHDEGNDEVREWLEKTTKLYCEADDMLDELSYEAMRIIQLEREEEIQKYYCMTTKKVCIDSLPLLLFCPRMSRKIKDFQHVLDELKQKLKMKFPDSRVVENHGIHEVGLSLTTIDIDYAFEQVYKIDVDKTDQVFGREEDKTKIVNILLMDHHPNNINEQQKLLVIPIIGAPDAGKKTVAKLIFDDETIKSHFDLRFWVYARSKGYEFEVKRVVKEIVEQSPRRRSMGDLTNWDNLQHMLEEILSGKKFLLVLTDVSLWSRDEERWNNLKTLLRVGSIGSTIIVTLQFRSDASIMGTVPPYELGELSLEASWELFRRKAFAFGSRGGALESADLVSIGRKLVRECGGFPLALTNLGAMMCFKENTEEWKAVLNTMRARSFYGIQKTNVLKICYDDMESPLKRCFAYCSVFPKNFIIEKKKLIQLWMAQGFLEQEASSSSSLLINNGGGDHDGVILMEDKGNAYFKSLVMRSFLRVVKMDDKGEPLECRMEDGLHDFALGYVDTGPYSGTYYLSHLVRDEFNSIPGIFFSMTNQVRTLLDCPNDISSYAKSIKFYKTLRVLELRHIKKDELPLSIGELIHLRYLDLSHGRFKSLPASISKLYHLQTLKLLHCRFLQRLPEGMTKLINLRHLEIESSLITPRGFGRLSNIQTFTIFKVGNSVTEAGIEELQCLEQLGGRLSLIGLNNVKNGADAEAANLKEKRRLQELTLEWESDWHVCTEEDSKKQEVVLEELRPHPNLFLLRILRFSGTKLPTWLNNRNSHLLNLRELCIYSCHHVKSLDMTDLRSLQKLMISYCENMEHAGVEGLMHLELLEFRGCDKLKSLGVKKGTNQEEHQVGSSRDKHVHNIVNLRSPLKVRIETCDRLTTLPEKLL